MLRVQTNSPDHILCDKDTAVVPVKPTAVHASHEPDIQPDRNRSLAMFILFEYSSIAKYL